ncbi:YybH family protein [Nesterenkonia sp. K-15-9-6]|uniref:YybH family protein n=1 Tax=Nesterenkonia sp. K-15-9-6 TaxID=3093918 RepID=UPI00404451AF
MTNRTGMTDEQQIREIIENWAKSIRVGDLEGVLSKHAEDVVMFDVPPPESGVRGLSEYRATWPGFFKWITSGATFEIAELDVVAGADVAYAIALLRCGSAEDLHAVPEHRLRLTIGLVKCADEWRVQHEHHSFTYVADRFGGEQVLREVHDGWSADTEAKDLDGIMSRIATGVVSYEDEAPLEHVGIHAVRERWRAGLEQTTERVTWTVPELTVVARDDLAVAWGLQRMTAQMPDGALSEEWSRGTRVFRRENGEWRMVHQHQSCPRHQGSLAADGPDV